VDDELGSLLPMQRHMPKRTGRTTLAEFNNPNGSFMKGDRYVFAYDYNGTCSPGRTSPARSV